MQPLNPLKDRTVLFSAIIEGIICLALMLPIAVVMAIAGGAVGGQCARRFGKTPLVCVAILPFLVSAAEQWIGPRYEFREVGTSIVIKAPPLPSGSRSSASLDILLVIRNRCESS